MGSIGFPELPPSQHALKVESLGQVVLKGRIHPLPQLEPEEVLVRVSCVALNPYDAKSVDMSPSPGATVGIDFSGEVVRLGQNVSSSELPLGTRVCAITFGNNPDRPDNGAFAEYVAVPATLVLRVPEGMSLQKAAAMACGIATAGLGLYHYLGLPLEASLDDTGHRVHVLVYGGGTATATIAVQVLRRSGFLPITTSSSHHFDRLKELGAEAVFDYRSPTCAQDIHKYTDGRLAYALDCITSTSSMRLCYEAIGPKGGRYVSLDPFPLHAHTRRSIRPEWIMVPTQFGKPISWDPPFNFLVRPTDVEFAKRWHKHAEKLLAEGLLESHPFQEESGGLQGLITGIDAVRKGHVVGYKLVYTI